MCFKRILDDKITPDISKTGILTSVLKKAKNPMIMDDYRGITVTPTVSKIFETTILPLLKQDFNQSSLQFGITEGLSMLMAAFIITRSSRGKNNHIGSINFNNIRQSKSF